MTEALIQSADLPSMEDITEETETVENGLVVLRLSEPNEGRWVISKSSRLVKSQVDLTGKQQLLLAACVAQINPLGNYNGDLAIKLTRADITRLTGINNSDLGAFLNRAATAILNCKYTYKDNEHSDDFTMLNMATKCQWKNGYFELHFSSHMKKELTQLKHYLSYRLETILPLSENKYALRLYEILKVLYIRRRGGIQKKTLTVRDTRFYLNVIDDEGKPIVPSLAKNFKDFKVRALLPSIKLINANTDLYIDEENIEYVRTGRVIGELVFPIRVISEAEKSLLKNSTLAMYLQEIGVGDNRIQKWLGHASEAQSDFPNDDTGLDTPENYIESCIEYTKDKIKSGMTINNPVGFIEYTIINRLIDAPIWADPYSDLYKHNPKAQEYVKQNFVGKYFKMDAETKRAILKDGLENGPFSEDYANFRHER